MARGDKGMILFFNTLAGTGVLRTGVSKHIFGLSIWSLGIIAKTLFGTALFLGGTGCFLGLFSGISIRSGHWVRARAKAGTRPRKCLLGLFIELGAGAGAGAGVGDSKSAVRSIISAIVIKNDLVDKRFKQFKNSKKMLFTVNRRASVHRSVGLVLGEIDRKM